MRLSVCVAVAFAAFAVGAPVVDVSEDHGLTAGEDTARQSPAAPAAETPTVDVVTTTSDETTAGALPSNGDQLVIRLGTKKQNVGIVDGSLYDAIYQALDYLCPYGTTQCRTDVYSLNVLHFDGSDVTKENLDVKVEHSYYGGANDAERLRRTIIKTVAAALEQSSINRKNCYTFKYGWEKQLLGEHCNVGDFVDLKIGKNTFFLRLSTRPALGVFDCPAILHAVSSYVDRRLLSQYGMSMEPVAGKVTQETMCSTNVNERDLEANGGGNIILALGNEKQNVGVLIGSALYGSIYKALEYLCPAGAEECRYHHDRRPEVYTLTVVYFDDFTLTQEKLELKVEYSYLGSNEPLRRLMIGTIAGALERASTEAKNCCDFIYGTIWKHKGRHCNVNDFVGLTIGEYRILLKVSTRTSDGVLDCPAALGAVTAYVDSLVPEYEQALGGTVTREPYCQTPYVVGDTQMGRNMTTRTGGE
ncbi:hypothetical protein BDV95DRAFT_603475 [Massariosphaeria phaeospora]|uniref:Uncharacterized protein n=1 Tax=Massariosphaeria phaeospora TaxID=100035 RepID=A0A7C8IF19_9PLEO|nr:hypothetical protein BDV95DRAFT_603475 [Massariosphaeria phaeospora]